MDNGLKAMKAMVFPASLVLPAWFDSKSVAVIAGV